MQFFLVTSHYPDGIFGRETLVRVGPFKSLARAQQESKNIGKYRNFTITALCKDLPDECKNPGPLSLEYRLVRKRWFHSFFDLMKSIKNKEDSRKDVVWKLFEK